MVYRKLRTAINKRPMGQIAHLRNQFKSMNTFALSFDHMYIYIS